MNHCDTTPGWVHMIVGAGGVALVLLILALAYLVFRMANDA